MEFLRYLVSVVTSWIDDAVAAIVEVFMSHRRAHKSDPSQHVTFAFGDLLVNGDGEVIIDKIIPHNSEFIAHPGRFISVELDRHEHEPPPCAGDGHHHHDRVKWEIFLKHIHNEHGHHYAEKKELMMLKICWDVSTVRTIRWIIRIPQ